MNVITKSVVAAAAMLTLAFSSPEASAQSPLLKQHIESIVAAKQATVGVAVWGP